MHLFLSLSEMQPMLVGEASTAEMWSWQKSRHSSTYTYKIYSS